VVNLWSKETLAKAIRELLHSYTTPTLMPRALFFAGYVLQVFLSAALLTLT
jgi:hypothetical protein